MNESVEAIYSKRIEMIKRAKKLSLEEDHADSSFMFLDVHGSSEHSVYIEVRLGCEDYKGDKRRDLEG